MASFGPNISGTGADDNSVGTITWNSPSLITTEDGAGALAIGTIGSTVTTHYIKGTNHGFSIPNGARITGIQADFKRKKADAGITVQDTSVKIVKAGVISGNEMANPSSSWPTSLAYVSYGGEDSLWGLEWEPGEINNSSFGVALSAKIVGTGEGSTNLTVDVIRITIFYRFLEPGGGVAYSGGGGLSFHHLPFSHSVCSPQHSSPSSSRPSSAI